MGKNHRHQKKLKKEKAKVQIKSKTKFLPKGQNITNTAFKIKPIVIREQLKEKDEDEARKQKFNVSELVSKLRHHNDNVKIEACQDLGEIFKKHSFELVRFHFPEIIQNVTVLIQDREYKVRKACINLLSSILEKRDFSELEPFFPSIIIQLKCAMTNINRNIQEDSLLLIDSLLEHQPNAISTKFNFSLNEFLSLISRLRSHSSIKRTLSVNLNSKTSDIEWRMKILTRLYGVLKATVEYIRQKETPKSRTIYRNADEGSWIPILGDRRPFEKTLADLYRSVEKEKAVININVGVLASLLYESWTEVVPEKTLEKRNSPIAPTILSQEAHIILNCSLKILVLMYEYTELKNCRNLFDCEEVPRFLHHLLKYFPYNFNRRGNVKANKDFSKSFTVTTDQNCVEENLLICYLFMVRENVGSKIKPLVDSISSYINYCLTPSNHLLHKANMHSMVKILVEIFMNRASMWHSHGVDGMKIMNNIGLLFDAGKIPESEKEAILNILTTSNLALKAKNHQEWIKKLPCLLQNASVSNTVIRKILVLCQRNNPLVQQGFRDALKNILQNLPKIEITETNDVEESKRHLAYILFYVKDLSEKDVELIETFCQTNCHLTYSKYLQQTMEQRTHYCR